MKALDPRTRVFHQQAVAVRLRHAIFGADRPRWWLVAGLASLVWLAVFAALRLLPHTGGTIQMQLQSDRTGSAQWFYDRGNGYSEGESVTATLGVGENHVIFQLPAGTYRALRFDPINNDGHIRIESVRITANFGIGVDRFDLAQFAPLANVASFTRDANGLDITPVAGSPDPQLLFEMIAPLELVAPRTIIGDVLTAVVYACVLLLLLGIVCQKSPSQKLVIAGMALAFGLILALAIASPITKSVHPDEFSHLSAFHYFVGHWLPPAVDDPAVIPSLSIYGESYLFELDVSYPIAARVVAPLIASTGSELMAARMFQCLLWVILCLFALRKKAWAIPLAVVLVSPQIWYVFSYFNGDAFPLFLTLIAAILLCDSDSGVHAYLTGKRGFGRVVLIFAVCLGVLLVSKLNYLPVIPGLLLWLAVLHLDLRWRELLAILCGLAVLGSSVFASAVPQWAAWHAHMIFTVTGASLLLCAAGIVVLRCYRNVALRRTLTRMLIVIGIIVAVAVPRVLQDVWVNGGPEAKSAKVLAVAEAHAGPEFKPSAIAHGMGYTTLGLASKGVSLSQILFEPYHWGAISLRSAFGVYGYMDIVAPTILYLALTISALFLAIVAAIALVRGCPDHAGRLLVVAAAVCGLVVLSSVLHSWTDDFQAQGRYFLPMAGMFALVLGQGAAKLPDRIFNVLLFVSLVLSACSFAGVALPAFTHMG